MKKILFILIAALMLIEIGAEAQNRKITFNENQSWQSVVDKAKQARKLIFVDCYTVWCGPCKIIDRDIFTNDRVADYFNENFINAKYDMEKDEGLILGKKYSVAAYPTLLFIDPHTQQVIHRFAGVRGVDDMMAQAKIANDPASNLQGIRESYEAGEKDAEALGEYLGALRRAGMSAEINSVTIEYLEELSNEEMMREENWKLLESNVIDPLSEPLQRIFADREFFYEVIGADRVQRKLSSSLIMAVNRFRNKEPEPVSDFNRERYDALMEFLSQTDDAVAPSCLAQLTIAGYAQNEEYGEMIDALSEILEGDVLSGQAKTVFTLTYLTKLIGKKDFQKEALALVDRIISSEKEDQTKASYYLIKSMMLDSYGDNKGAEKAKSEAQKLRESGGRRPQMMQIGN